MCCRNWIFVYYFDKPEAKKELNQIKVLERFGTVAFNKRDYF
jgi:hypothetical protein